MTVALETARRETSGWRVYPLAVYYFLIGNLLLTVGIVGVLQIAFGFALDQYYVPPQGEWGFGEPPASAIFSGFFGVWGATLILLGFGGHGILWLNKLVTRSFRSEGLS